MFSFPQLLAQVEVGFYMLVEDWHRDRNTQPIRGSRFIIGTPRELTHGSGAGCNCRYAPDRCQCIACTLKIPTIKFDWHPRKRTLFMMSLVNVFARSTRVLNKSQAAKLTRACNRKLRGECG